MPKQSEARLFRERIFSPLLRESVLPICILLPAAFSRKIIRKSLAHGKGASPFASAYLLLLYSVNDVALTVITLPRVFNLSKLRVSVPPMFKLSVEECARVWICGLPMLGECLLRVDEICTDFLGKRRERMFPLSSQVSAVPIYLLCFCAVVLWAGGISAPSYVPRRVLSRRFCGREVYHRSSLRTMAAPLAARAMAAMPFFAASLER